MALDLGGLKSRQRLRSPDSTSAPLTGKLAVTTGYLIAAFVSGLLIGVALVLYWLGFHRRWL